MALKTLVHKTNFVPEKFGSKNIWAKRIVLKKICWQKLKPPKYWVQKVWSKSDQ